MAAVGGYGVVDNYILNDDAPSEPDNIIQVDEPSADLPYDISTITAVDIVRSYTEASIHTDRLLLLDPDGENGFYAINERGLPVTDRGNLYYQILELSEQLIEDGVGSPERIIGAGAESFLQGTDRLVQPHSVSPSGDEDIQHYSYITPFSRDITTHHLETTLGWMRDPSIVLVSPYNSMSYELFVGFHEMAHAIELLTNLRDDKASMSDDRVILLMEGVADLTAMIAFESAAYTYGDILEGTDMEMGQRLSDLRNIAVIQSVIQSGGTGSMDKYYIHMFSNSFMPVLDQMRQDGVLADLTIEEIVALARDHVDYVARNKITADYMEEMRQVMLDAADDLRGLTFAEQSVMIQSWLEDNRYDGNAREYFVGYLESVERIMSAQAHLSPEQLFESWQAQVQQANENQIDIERVLALEISFMNEIYGNLVQTTSMINEEQGREAATQYYNFVMFGGEGATHVPLMDRLEYLEQQREGYDYERRSDVPVTERLAEPPAYAVRLAPQDALDYYADMIFGDNRGRVALVNVSNVFDVDNSGNMQIDPGGIGPEILSDVHEYLRENRNDNAAQILGGLRGTLANGVWQRVPQDSFVIASLAGSPDGETFVLLSPPSQELTAHQMEQRIAVSYDPDVSWVSSIDSDAMRTFLTMRSMYEVAMLFQEQEDQRERLLGNDDHFESEDRFNFQIQGNMVDSPPGRMQYNAFLDLYALLLMHKAEVENPRSFGTPVYELGQRLAQLRDLSVFNTYITDGNTEHAFDYYSSRYIEPFLSYMQHGIDGEELRDMTPQDIVDTVNQFMQFQAQSFTPEEFTELYRTLEQVYNLGDEGADMSEMGFIERRTILNETLLPRMRSNSPNSELTILFDRINDAAWEIVPPMTADRFASLWQQTIMPIDEFSREEALIRVNLEQQWIMQQAAANEIELPRSGDAVVEASEATPMPAEARLAALERFKEALTAVPVFYSPDEAYEILTENLRVMTIQIDGRLVQVMVEPDMIARNGMEVIVPPGRIGGVDRPVVVRVPMEYINMLDPEGEARRANPEAEVNSYILSVPVRDGQNISVIVTEDMISEDGSFVTLPDGSLPPQFENGDGEIKIYVGPGSLERIQELEAEQEAAEEADTEAEAEEVNASGARLNDTSPVETEQTFRLQNNRLLPR